MYWPNGRLLTYAALLAEIVALDDAGLAWLVVLAGVPTCVKLASNVACAIILVPLGDGLFGLNCHCVRRSHLPLLFAQ